MKISWEMTDTFGGEFNYSWVRRGTVEVDDNATDAQITRACKRDAGITGQRMVKEFCAGDISTYRFVGACIGFYWYVS